MWGLGPKVCKKVLKDISYFDTSSCNLWRIFWRKFKAIGHHCHHFGNIGFQIGTLGVSHMEGWFNYPVQIAIPQKDREWRLQNYAHVGLQKYMILL